MNSLIRRRLRCKRNTIGCKMQNIFALIFCELFVSVGLAFDYVKLDSRIRERKEKQWSKRDGK